ncbi:hypothetical protein [Streptomyces cyaneofuscatus]|uniref:Helix-turn-helix domain-containing protein n=1 Tax=Streptomyces cyaneofuscatus TaxID=66883 RepID=A0ABZ1EZ84_9ACTN|nr:hypothetical protein [Streptomyces cyaneofuscatus]WSB09440.1 hypothetical protein OG849_20485 [Streptomyces cyaneofuscatus]WSD47024.1 hypothetical protein OG857_14915 [Streptomyces cyaneofuscatus]
MLSHVIPPPRGYTKVSNGLVRQSRLGSDAKILVMYVQGLPEDDRDKALSEHARDLHFTGRRYQKAKTELVASGYLHEKRETVAGGRWRTVQVFSNFPLTDDQAARLRAGVPADGYELVSTGPVPTAHFPTVGAPSGPVVGGLLPADEELGKNESHPPTEAGSGVGERGGPEGPGGPEDLQGPEDLERAEDLEGAEGEVSEEASEGLLEEPSEGPEVAIAERVLLSLRHEQRQLHLGVREARTLAGLAAEWLRRGVTAADLRRALCSGLPVEGVRTAVGFLAHRLREKLPAVPESVPAPEPTPPPPALIACAGPGEEHVFRPHVPWATTCGPCHREEQRAFWADAQARADAAPEPPPWRERFAAVAEGGAVSDADADADADAEGGASVTRSRSQVEAV